VKIVAATSVKTLMARGIVRLPDLTLGPETPANGGAFRGGAPPRDEFPETATIFELDDTTEAPCGDDTRRGRAGGGMLYADQMVFAQPLGKETGGHHHRAEGSRISRCGKKSSGAPSFSEENVRAAR
jgi:hypothetical protein